LCAGQGIGLYNILSLRGKKTQLKPGKNRNKDFALQIFQSFYEKRLKKIATEANSTDFVSSICPE